MSNSHFFSKNTCELDIVLTRTVNILTTNELVKLTRLWTTGPWRINYFQGLPLKENQSVFEIRLGLMYLLVKYTESYWQHHSKTCLQAYTDSEGLDQPAHLRYAGWSGPLLSANRIMDTTKCIITKTCLYNIDPLKPHIYIVKLGFTGVYIIFLISSQKHRLWVLIRTASPRQF